MFKKHRKAIESTYLDICNVYRYEKTKDRESGETTQKPVAYIENQPCRVSQKVLSSNTQTEAENKIVYETKLFLPPELEINQGAMLIVCRGSTKRKYEAGEPFVYPTHQEISIQRKEWA